MKCIDLVSAQELFGKKVLLRADFNVPLDNCGIVADNFRLKQGWATIQFLIDQGSKVIICSHIGRDPQESIEPVAMALQQFGKVRYVDAVAGIKVENAIDEMKNGDVILLANLRSDAREKANDESLARELAQLADIYVDDAFAAMHRAHASIVGVPRFLPNYAGLLVRDEIQSIDAARNPISPSFAILGGSKFETKAPLVSLLLDKYDGLFLTGALANDVLKARGFEVGKSLVSKELPNSDVLENAKLIAPLDVVVDGGSGGDLKAATALHPSDIIMDCGSATLDKLHELIMQANFVLWNGPTGWYEKGYLEGTRVIAEMLIEKTNSGARVVIGGGDTIAAIEASGVDSRRCGFLSTGGGAMLEFLLKGTLPGVDALR